MKKLIPILLTVAVLVALYANLDRGALWERLKEIRVGFFLLALLFFVPQIVISAWRWQWMVRHVLRMHLWETCRLILAGKALNALLPSKLGETSKAYFLKTHAGVPLSTGVALVVLEKALDTMSLCLIMLAGLVLLPRMGAVEMIAAAAAVAAIALIAGLLVMRTAWLRRWIPRRGKLWERAHAVLAGWDAVLDSWKQERGRFAVTLALSCLLWAVNVAQVFLFFPALSSRVALSVMIPYVPLSIFVGLLPITIGGMGTRDSALIFLFAPYESAAVMAGIGVLCSVRYFMDTLCGLPFFHAYSAAPREAE